MKTRSGFVSNSSSSSFIVVFPHKPATVDELRNMIFGDRDPKEIMSPSWDDKNEFLYTIEDLSTQIFKDLNRRNQTSIEVDTLVDKMENLYYYSTFDCTEFSGWIFRDSSPFFGSDKDTTNALMNHELESERLMNKLDQEEINYINGIIKKSGVVIDTNDSENDDYQEAFNKTVEFARRNDRGFIKFRENYHKTRHDLWATSRMLREKAAKADAAVMINTYPGSFIAHFEYGDSGGDFVPICMGSILEDREIWNKLPNVVISNR